MPNEYEGMEMGYVSIHTTAIASHQYTLGMKQYSDATCRHIKPSMVLIVDSKLNKQALILLDKQWKDPFEES